MQTIAIEQDKETLTQIIQIQTTLLEIKNELRSLKAQISINNSTQANDWINATDFCKKFGMSRPTLKERVKSGLVEVKSLGKGALRYKWKKEEK